MDEQYLLFFHLLNDDFDEMYVVVVVLIEMHWNEYDWIDVVEEHWNVLLKWLNDDYVYDELQNFG